VIVLIGGPMDLRLSDGQIEAATTASGFVLGEYRTVEDMFGVGASVENYAKARGIPHIRLSILPSLKGRDMIGAGVQRADAVLVVKRRGQSDPVSDALLELARAKDKRLYVEEVEAQLV
jgi:hypothetical protein